MRYWFIVALLFAGCREVCIDAPDAQSPTCTPDRLDADVADATADRAL